MLVTRNSIDNNFIFPSLRYDAKNIKMRNNDAVIGTKNHVPKILILFLINIMNNGADNAIYGFFVITYIIRNNAAIAIIKNNAGRY